MFSETVSVSSEYGPFGELLRATGLMAKANPFRFSTKFQDDETDLVYYGYRYYNSSTGRWPNRDPIGELGFQTLTNGKRGKRLREELNLYDFVRNDGLNHFDVLGLEEGETWDQTYERLRDRENYGPLKACEEANKIHGTSKSCSALGRDPKPKLYCGCSYSKILDAANWLRHNADGRPAGADKLAHCYAFCVGSFWYGNITRFYTDDSDPEDVEANKKGISIGLGWTFNPCSCLDKCAKATRDMNFN